MSYRGHDVRIESICTECVNFGDCKFASEGKTICNKFKACFDEPI